MKERQYKQVRGCVSVSVCRRVRERGAGGACRDESRALKSDKEVSQARESKEKASKAQRGQVELRL